MIEWIQKTIDLNCVIYICRYPSFYFGETSIETTCLYWLYEIWICHFSTVRIIHKSNYAHYLGLSSYSSLTVLLSNEMKLKFYTVGWNIMNLNIGNLGRWEISISDMRLDSSISYPTIWLHTYLLISKFFFNTFTTKNPECFKFRWVAAKYCTSMQMKMFPLGHG